MLLIALAVVVSVTFLGSAGILATLVNTYQKGLTRLNSVITEYAILGSFLITLAFSVLFFVEVLRW